MAHHESPNPDHNATPAPSIGLDSGEPGTVREQIEARIKALLTEDRLLAQGRSLGIDLRDRAQVLDAAAVGLTVLLWRNNLDRLHSDSVQPPGSVSDSEIEALILAEQEALSANVGSYQQAADPAELVRLDLFLRSCRHDTIPDDIVMRTNCSTVAEVRALLENTVNEAMTEPGTAPLRHTGAGTPAFLRDAIGLLDNPNRTITVGAAEFTAIDLLGDRGWETFRSNIHRELSGPTALIARLVGDRQALWHVALSGASVGAYWFPNRPWAAAVDELEHLARTGGGTHPPECGREVDAGVADTPGFWAALRTDPARLNARQADWVMTSRLEDLMNTIARRHAEELGADPGEQFQPWHATF